MAASFMPCPFCRLVNNTVERTGSEAWRLVHHCSDDKTMITMYADTEEELIEKWNAGAAAYDDRAKLLSLSEVYQSFGKPIWLEADWCPEGVYAVPEESYRAWEIDYTTFGSDDNCTLDIDDYNKKWFPYDRKPHGR